MRLIWTFLSKLAWRILRLRYKIEIKGLDQLPTTGGVLFLPNHPALMDPLMLFIRLWPRFQMRPLVTEYIYRTSFMKPLMKLTGGMPIPSFSTSINELKVKKAKESIQAVADGLREGKNFILYPSGKLKTSAREEVGGSSGAHEICGQYPEANIVLVRTTGLWGSSFSRAITGNSPDLGKTLLRGMWVLLKNGIFFAPRRKVTINIALAPEGLPRGGTRLEFNRFLEAWYNQYVDEDGKTHKKEPLKLVSYSFWKKDVLKVAKQHAKEADTSHVEISPETEEKIYKELRQILKSPDLEIKPHMKLATDLGMDSLNVAEIIGFLAQKFDLQEVHPEDVETVRDILETAENAKTAPRETKSASTHKFPEEVERPSPKAPAGDTLQEAFLRICQKMGDYIACADDVHGAMSYKKLKRNALVLAMQFRKFPESHIAVMLPASAGAYLVIFALLLANKVPVMLNWTLGPRYLEEMMRISDAKRVLSSWRFLEKLSHVEFGSLIDDIELLEDIRDQIRLKDKFKGLCLSFQPPRAVLNSLGLDEKDENEPAVVLFTSGTEAAPKGVPLSHKNFLTNQRETILSIDLSADDVIYGILPPFHSFGFSLAGTLPILSGLRVAFFPDPTDSFSLAEGVERWKVTLFCSAPNFLKGLFYAAKPKQLATIRLFVSGAEKASKELFEFAEKLGTGAKLVEGYGITECAPVLSLNRLNLPPKGVGHLLANVEACTIHLETSALLEKGAEGEICVRGPNVFSGYLDNPRSPFIEINGEQWYRTGDIGRIDEDRCLILSGRLKRFTKLGGEMISLGAIEEVLNEALLKEEKTPPETPILAVCAHEEPDTKPEIIVFTRRDLTLDRASTILREAGLSRLIKISRIEKIAEIPLLGTGKTNYRELQKQIS